MKWVHLIILVVVITVGWRACDQHFKEESAERCRDAYCPGDIYPKAGGPDEFALKLNARWYLAPKEYGGFGPRLDFFWPSKLPANSPGVDAVLKAANKYDDGRVSIFLRSTHIPLKPHGYQKIQEALAKGGVVDSRVLRDGLTVYRLKDPSAPSADAVDERSYYVADKLKGYDGLPPVASCNHTQPDGWGGTGFLWRDGIWVGVRMNQRHCQDWPEVFTEVVRVIETIRKVE